MSKSRRLGLPDRWTDLLRDVLPCLFLPLFRMPRHPPLRYAGLAVPGSGISVRSKSFGDCGCLLRAVPPLRLARMFVPPLCTSMPAAVPTSPLIQTLSDNHCLWISVAMYRMDWESVSTGDILGSLRNAFGHSFRGRASRCQGFHSRSCRPALPAPRF
eukprot:UN0508